MMDSMWFWLYMIVGATLCCTNIAGLYLSGRRIPKGSELAGGAYIFAMLAVIFVAWPLVIVWNLLGHVFSETTR